MNTKTVFTRILIAAAALATPGFAQEQWEVGVSAGYGFYKNVKATNSSGEASTGFKPGVAFGVVAGNEINNWLGGEVHYTYQQNDLKVSSGGTNVQFSGDSHTMHYDFVFHGAPRKARVRPFLAGGAGIKYYRGTGEERAVQPLIKFVALSRTSEVVPVISVGGGVKVQMSPRLVLRVEARDYITPFPREVIAPVPGASVSGWLHGFVPTVGISYQLGR